MTDFTEEELELLEPAPDIHALFVHYNQLYFEGQLGACSVEWSSARMTLCGGVCEWQPGGGCRIKLSEPLLKLRPSRDLKETLLHEMIHAYMMLGGIRDDEPSGHGTIFKSVLNRINASTLPDSQRPPGGYRIDTHHTMLAEVEHYRQHHWRCDRCGHLVKRAMNRPPQEADCRGRVGKGAACRDTNCAFHMHMRHCGGSFIKIKEPEGYQDKKRGGKRAGSGSSSDQQAGGGEAPAKRPRKKDAAVGTQDITKFFGQAGASLPPPQRGPSRLGAGSSGVAHPAIEAVISAAAAAAGQRGGGSPQLQEQAQQAVGSGQQQQQQPWQPENEGGEPPAAERRRLLAEAALRRLAGATAPAAEPGPLSQRARSQEQVPGAAAAAAAAAAVPLLPLLGQPTLQREQQQRQAVGEPRGLREPPISPGGTQAGRQHPSPGQSSPELIDLTASPWHTQQQQQQGEGAEQIEDLTCSPPIGVDTGQLEAAAQRGRAGTLLECPICGQRWVAGELSNEALNAHVDECLNGGLLAGGGSGG